jgi:putative aldouronate transport system substrate-binding protein
MSKVKRIAAVVLAFCAFALLMAGCGGAPATPGGTAAQTAAAGTQAEGTASAPAETTVAPAEEKTLDPYNIVWVMPDNYSDATEIQLVQDEANKVTQEKFNATVELRILPFGDYDQKVQVMSSAGEKFDVFLSANWSGLDYKLMAAKGAAVSMKDLIPQYGQDMLNTLPDYLWDGTTYKGEIYAIPTYKDLAAPYGMLINQGMADKYGMDFSNVRKVEDMEPFFQTIKESEPADTVAYYPGTNAYNDWIIPVEPVSSGIPAVIRTDSVDYKVQSVYEVPETMDYALATFRRWYQNGYIQKDYLTAGQPDGPTGKWFAQAIMLPAFGEVYRSIEWNMDLSLINFGTSTGYGTGVGYMFYDGIAASCMSISATSGDPARAMMLLNLHTTDAAYHNIIVKGIEGRHYKKVSDGVIDTTGMEHQWALNEWTWGNIFLNYLIPSDPPNKWEIYMKDNDESIKSPLVGFAFDPDAVKTEIAALANVSEEFRNPIWSGSVDPKEYVPKAIDKYNAAGLDAIIAEMQRQLDAWRASNNG